jgi:hypothetical protein
MKSESNLVDFLELLNVQVILYNVKCNQRSKIYIWNGFQFGENLMKPEE